MAADLRPLAPPELLPDERGVRWNWTRSAWHYAYNAIELVRRLDRELAELRKDLAALYGGRVGEQEKYTGALLAVQERLTELEERPASASAGELAAMRAELAELTAWKNRVFGGWTVGKAILTSSIVSTVIATLLLRALR